jgi:hypothetical protein
MKQYGLIKSSLDAHTLGINSIRGQLEECKQNVCVGEYNIEVALRNIHQNENKELIAQWLLKHRITHLGISYRLDPMDAFHIIHELMTLLRESNLMDESGGFLQKIFFAGLPQSCQLIEEEYGPLIKCFIGSENTRETLIKMGLEESEIPSKLLEGSMYDYELKRIATDYVSSNHHKTYVPVKNPNYREFGTNQDHLMLRLKNHQEISDLPLTRVHVGPYLTNREEAIRLFEDWCQELAEMNYLDIISIGSSQLTQSNFNEDWTGLSNGGGVPIQTSEEYRRIYHKSRPLLLRTYSGTKNVPNLAKIHEETINIAWHALSFWWFNQLDGRGPNSLLTNLHEHIETLKYIAKSNKPFEPNIPHHFAFRGSDDVTYVLSAVLAARTAKKYGIKDFILQIMLNTPRYTWGTVDIAKARAILHLIQPLINKSFNVLLQPRAGLDYFAPDIDLAKIQLAQVSMLMDDIEPHKGNSPEIVHVVSYSEALYLATPNIINESIQITLGSMEYYRDYKSKHPEFLNQFEKDIANRMNELIKDVTYLLESIELNIVNPYTAQGLYDIFKYGYLQTPYLWANKEEFPYANYFKTNVYHGSTYLYDKNEERVDTKKLSAFAQSNIKR